MRTLAGLVLATLIASPAWATGAGAPAATTHPSVAQTASLEFLGKRFERKWQSVGTRWRTLASIGPKHAGSPQASEPAEEALGLEPLKEYRER